MPTLSVKSSPTPANSRWRGRSKRGQYVDMDGKEAEDAAGGAGAASAEVAEEPVFAEYSLEKQSYVFR